MPLEINLLGKWAGRNYPDIRFWELAAEENCTVIVGCDAHAPDHLRKFEAEAAAAEMIRRLGLKQIHTTTLHKV